MVELTKEEKEMLDLSRERLEGLARAETAEKRTEMRSILNRFTDSLRDKARLIEDASEREKALSGIAEKGKAARKYITEQLKTKPMKQERASQQQSSGMVSNIMSLNLYNQGARVSSNQLLNQKIKGSIDVRSPKAEVMKELNMMLGPTSLINEELRYNLEKVKEVLEDRLETTQYSSFTIDINSVLGAIDVSKKSNRIEVYNYWAKIGGLYEQFEEDMANFFIEVREIEWDETTQSKFDDLSRRFNDLNLEYIAKFDNVDRKFESGYHRFFNAVSYKLAMDRMLTKETNAGNYKDEFDAADVNQELLQDMSSSLSRGSNEGDTVDLSELGEEYTWKDELGHILESTDPLLVYEYNRGEKLIAITQDMEREILEVLDDILDSLDEGEGVTLETTRDVEEWLEQVEDTQILDEGEVDVMALPISVLNNAKFNQIYEEDSFPSFVDGEKISVQNIDNIKNFFNDLYEILSDDDFRMEVEARSSKGRGRGSDFEAREAQGSTVGLIGGAKVPLSLNQKGQLRGELEGFKSDLQKMMDSAIAYFFDPIYSGMLPIEMPNFASSIGSKVMQTLSLDLGLDTVMSGAYDTLFEGSREEIDVGDMNAIADFLNVIFMPEVKIDSGLITDGEEFADALTEIFGQGTQEKNNNYAAALLHHYMRETGSMEKEKKDFDGKSIKKRAEQFYKDFKARKPFPVFALPHWLDMNQGILTKKSPASKKAYNNLKAIFESAQVDLPVLLHKLLKAHDAIREQLGKQVIYGQIPLNDYGINKMITKLQVDDNIDLTSFEVEQIIKAVDSHENISREYGISSEQVYLIKASFR
jgi:hypothetical protein